MKIHTRLWAILVLAILLTSCKSKVEEKPKEETSLKNAYKNDFLIGTALSEAHINENPDAKITKLISKEFNSITAENLMKSMFVHPEKEIFDFNLSDKFIAYGEEHNMFVHGHTLIWHSQLAPWFKNIKDSTEMVQAMENHIKTIVGRYKGKIGSWDVVNEALNDDGTLRNSVFLEMLGEDYLPMVFKWVQEADPDVELFYNDYSMTLPEKRAGAIRIIKQIQDKGVKIDGVGMQGHWNLKTPSLEIIEQSILDYAALGVKVAITELDVSVLPSPWGLQGAEISQRFENTPKMNPYPQTLPDSVQTQLAQRYQDIFKLFLKHKDKISRVTFWGVNDSQTWLNDFPIKGRTNYPLLFDRALNTKPAYDSIIALKLNKTLQ